MTPRQRIFAAVVALALVVLIIELVRRRKLKEEYSMLWLATSAGVLVFSISYDLQLFITRLIGAVSSTTTVFGLGFLFLILTSLHYSVRLSKLTDQVKTMAQEIAILKAEKGGGHKPE